MLETGFDSTSTIVVCVGSIGSLSAQSSQGLALSIGAVHLAFGVDEQFLFG